MRNNCELQHFGPKRKRVDVRNLMPVKFDLPYDAGEYHKPSENPMINFCESLKRKADMLNNNFRGTRIPKYMQVSPYRATFEEAALPVIVDVVVKSPKKLSFERTSTLATKKK